MMDHNSPSAKPSRSCPTPDAIRKLLSTNMVAVEEAILRLHARQSQDERRSAITIHKNCRGFSAAHAKSGSKFAGWIKGMREQGAQPGFAFKSPAKAQEARELALHYVRQIHEEAVAKFEAAKPPAVVTFVDAALAARIEAEELREAAEHSAYLHEMAQLQNDAAGAI